MARTWLVLSVGEVNKTVQTIKFVLPGHILFPRTVLRIARLWPSRAGNGSSWSLAFRPGPGQKIALIVVARDARNWLFMETRWRPNLIWESNSIFVLHAS